MIYILYNPLADNRNGGSNAENIGKVLETKDVTYLDITGMDAAEFLRKAKPEDKVVLSGGDGTLHHFVNECGGQAPEHPVYYYPTGSGNDFMADVREREKDGLVLLNLYIQNLPTVTVKGETRYFLNGVGYGIDGYCCEEGDRQRAESSNTINYAAIAIKGMMSAFQPVEAPTRFILLRSSRFRKPLKTGCLTNQIPQAGGVGRADANGFYQLIGHFYEKGFFPFSARS